MGRLLQACCIRLRACGAAAALACLLPMPAWADDPTTNDGPTLPYSLTAAGDIRVVGADGEDSWLDGGFGKTRFSGGDNGKFAVHPRAVEAAVAWQPHFTWSLSGTFVAIAQRGQDQPVDLSEAYLTFKPMPIGKLRLSFRAGIFWPPISLEHTGPEWAVRDTITPSAINSWIGEEVKTTGFEVTASTEIAGNRLSAIAGLFGFNDTAGTLLAYRGWL